MIQTVPLRIDSVRAQQSADRHHGLYAYVAVLAVGLVIGLAGFGPFDVQFALAFALLACAATAVLLRPIAGVYVTVFFALLGDGVAMVGYPFNINFSSPESILYVNGALTFSPVELFLVLTGVSWFAHVAGTRSWHVFGRPLLWPLVVFAGLIGVGLLYGVGLYGGDLTTGMWELRPLLYTVAMYFFASNLFTRTAHYVSLAWAVVLTISVQNIFAIAFYLGLSAPDRLALESLTEHPTSVFYTVGHPLDLGGMRAARLFALGAVPVGSGRHPDRVRVRAVATTSCLCWACCWLHRFRHRVVLPATQGVLHPVAERPDTHGGVHRRVLECQRRGGLWGACDQVSVRA